MRLLFHDTARREQPMWGYQVLLVSFDVSNTHVRVGVALGNAGEVAVVVYLDSLFVTYDGCSIS